MRLFVAVALCVPACESHRGSETVWERSHLSSQQKQIQREQVKLLLQRGDLHSLAGTPASAISRLLSLADARRTHNGRVEYMFTELPTLEGPGWLRIVVLEPAGEIADIEMFNPEW